MMVAFVLQEILLRCDYSNVLRLRIIASAKEVMFLPEFVCLPAC